RYIHAAFHRNYLKNIDQLIPLETQTRRDSWQSVRDLVYTYLKKTNGRFPLYKVRQEYKQVRQVYEEGTRDLRKALNELANLETDKEAIVADSSKPFYYGRPEEETSQSRDSAEGPETYTGPDSAPFFTGS
ncbi:MAG TPA: hypothetical protein VKO20_06915, partial [Desulfosalsimonadaceae bacterium]|nr:hypothetical protein [Desulfosalsimonadaceae bacterium]